MKETKSSITQKKIKSVALKLFNEQLSTSITTNHIAKEADISPGNLYYHFKNKEDIIVSIYEDMSETFESFESFEQILSSQNPIKVLWDMFEKYGELFWNYRFIMRDINTLICMYPRLKEMFLKKQEKRVIQIEGLIRYFISLGVFEEASDEDINLRARLNWFVASYWNFFAQSTGKTTQEAISETRDLIFKVNVYPYLTQKGKELAHI